MSEKLRISEFLPSTVLDHISEGFQVIGRDWCYLYLNNAAVEHSKFSKEELVGFSIIEKYPGIEKTDMFQALKMCMNHEIPAKIENEFTYPDGTKNWFELSIQPVPDGICILSIDVSKQKSSYEQLFELNTVIEKKIRTRNAELEHKNRYVTDSLNYAQKIQKAFLQQKSEIRDLLPKSLLLYKPKDILSGDFYYCQESDDKIVLVVADCTGHGVPGALVSMIGIEKLKNLVLKSNNCSDLLEQLNKSIKTTLGKSTGEGNCQDGMDMAVCSIDTKTQTVSFAGANRPFWLIRKGQSDVEEIKATKRAIGGCTPHNQHFASHSINLQSGDTFYIFSDGYADTFGVNGKKLMKGKFKEILLGIQEKAMEDQELYLDNFIENWKGSCDQIDDILVIGVRM